MAGGDVLNQTQIVAGLAVFGVAGELLAIEETGSLVVASSEVTVPQHEECRRMFGTYLQTRHVGLGRLIVLLEPVEQVSAA